jgi:hypothetical protein
MNIYKIDFHAKTDSIHFIYKDVTVTANSRAEALEVARKFARSKAKMPTGSTEQDFYNAISYQISTIAENLPNEPSIIHANLNTN